MSAFAPRAVIQSQRALTFANSSTSPRSARSCYPHARWSAVTMRQPEVASLRDHRQ